MLPGAGICAFPGGRRDFLQSAVRSEVGIS